MSAGKPKRSSRLRSTPPSIAQATKQARRRPGDDRAWHALGLSYLQQQRVDDARTAFERAADLAPNSPEHQEWLGYVLYRQRENDTALTHLDQAQQKRPDSVLALTTRARIYLDRNDGRQALECIQRAAESAPDNGDVQTLLCQALHRNHDFDRAIELSKKLIEREPGNYHHWNNRGNIYRDLALIDEANRCYQRATELNDADPVPFSNWITGLHYDPSADRDAIRQLALEWQARFAPSDPPARPVPTDRRSDKRLRLGLLSDGFRQHPVGKMIVRCLEHLNSSEFELFAYTSNDTRDPLTKRIRGMCQQWLPIQHLSDDELAQRIRDDRVDVFIDLSGHNTGSRMRAVAMQPAPLIVKWVGGLINTTGVGAIDYLISDAIETPPGEDAFYSEKLIRMPNDYIVFDPPQHMPEIGELPASRNGHITLGCFNNPSKLNDVALTEWAKIMHRLPGSKLMLKGHAYAHQELTERLYVSFEEKGIQRERLILEGPGDNRAMLQAYNRVDIALDPWPYSGGLTTCEGFLMGVPVVTLPGPTFAGRHSATHLINASMPELVVTSWDEYRARVVELAEDLDNLASIRRMLREVLLRSPVCDGEKFAQHFTTAMRAIWQRYCEAKPRAALTINAEGQALFADRNETETLHHPAPEPDDRFKWEFQGKIIAIDNGGRLLDRAPLREMIGQHALELVVFDPASRSVKVPLLQHEAVHYYPNIGLGNGQPATLHACLNPDFSSTLLPISESTDAIANDSRQVIARLPVNTVPLDDIEGLSHIDWVILDALSDAASILDHGRRRLAEVLLVQVRVRFKPTHEHQPSLAELQHWAARNGFDLYRLQDMRHVQPQSNDNPPALTPTLLQTTDVLFVPDAERMNSLSDNQRTKLAFLLHTVFGIRDLPYELIARTQPEAAARYLASLSPDPVVDTPAVESTHAAVTIPDAPHMTTSERELFARALKKATRYFEFGSGGSTVWAVGENLRVDGVDSDEQWIDALKLRLGDRCRLKTIDIGPVGEWGYPTSARHAHKFPDYSRAIFEHSDAFDLILVDGRFRVACTIAAIQHILRKSESRQTSRIFIHDFWERPNYHRVLQFLEPTGQAETAGLFRIKPDLDQEVLSKVWEKYARIAD